jgi:hypothetical protein
VLLSVIGFFFRFGSNAHRHDDVLEGFVAGQHEKCAGVCVGEVQFDGFVADVVEDVEQVGDVEADIQRFAAVIDLDFFLGFFLFGVAGNDLEASGDSGRGARREIFVGQNRGTQKRMQQVLRDSLISLLWCWGSRARNPGIFRLSVWKPARCCRN